MNSTAQGRRERPAFTKESAPVPLHNYSDFRNSISVSGAR